MALESFFLYPGGLVFLALLIPLLLLYLIKPKPLRRMIPSLMFILQDAGKNKINRLFRNWLNDILLLLHFFIIVFVLASIAQPFVMVPQSFLVSDTILVIDVSASTKAGDRWADIRLEALDSLSERNTIILAQGFPEMIADSVTAGRARVAIKRLEPKDTTTNLADAIRLAAQFAGPSTNVIILSDFLPSAGALEIASQIDAIRSKGAIVKEVSVGEPTPNLGIIDLVVRDEESRLWVKNYDDRPVDVTLVIGETEQQILLAKRETKEISFATPNGVTEITIKEKDAFMIDNTAWISTPSDNQVEILVFTNQREKFESSNLMLAFQLIDKNFPVTLDIQYAIPPKVPDLDHDIYLFYEVKPDFVLPGVIKNIQKKVEDGAGLILTAQNNLFAFDLQGMMPVENPDLGVIADVGATAENPLTRDINFGQVQSHYKVTAKEGVTTVAQAGDSPIITLSKIGKGTIVYYGYFEGKESFSVDNSFPIFWRRIIDLITNRPSLQNLNVKTGEILTFPQDLRIKTPTERIQTNLLRTEQAGLYVLPDRTIAANLLSDLESNINRDPATGKDDDDNAEENTRKVPKDLARIVLMIGAVLLLLELLYIKFRGDL